MASSQVLLLAIAAVVAAACFPGLASATDWTVGDDGGWGPKFNQTGWTNNKYFKVGDTLLFKYDMTKHTLVEVGKEDFAACNENAKPNLKNTGNDTVALDKPVKRWFICTKPGHCAAGMNLVLNVLDANATIPSPAPASPPSAAPLGYTAAAAARVVVAAAAMVAAVLAL